MSGEPEISNAAGITFESDPRCPKGWMVAWNSVGGYFSASRIDGTRGFAGRADSLGEVFLACLAFPPSPIPPEAP